MAVSDATIQHVTDMGTRAGQDWRDTGMPSPNPFDQGKQPILAQAWRRAYFAAGSPAKPSSETTPNRPASRRISPSIRAARLNRP